MKEHKNLPVQFNERIHALGIDYGVVFLSVLIVIFLYIDPIYKMVIVLIVWYIMNIVPSFFKRGISLGKLNSRTIVVDENNKKVSLLVMHLREFFILFIGLASIGFYFLIAFYLLTKRTDKRSIHDLLFKTKVVYIESLISGWIIYLLIEKRCVCEHFWISEF